MSEQLNSDVFVMDVLNEANNFLNSVQLSNLKSILYMKLHDISLVVQHYDIAVTAEESDHKKVEHFAISRKLEGIAEGSIKQYVRSAWALRTFIGKNFEDITTDDIRYYLGMMQLKRRWSELTTDTQRIYLNVFFTFLADREWICKNPVSPVKSIKYEKQIKRPFNAIEMESIRIACGTNTRNRAIVEFLYATGLRVSNVVALQWKDLDMRNKKITVRLKGGKYKEIYFNRKSMFYLYKMLEDRMNKEHRSLEEMMNRPVFANAKRDKKTKDWEAISDDGIRYVLNKLGDKANIKKVHPHRFRRTFACRAINRGMPLEKLKEHMGHESYDTTLIYAEIDNSSIEQSYRKYCD